MTHPDMSALFDLLDRWRHLPSYRLEPRADAMFGLFLPDALDRHLAPRGIAVDPWIIPEFPLRQIGSNRSDKADFFAVSRDREYAFLVELKTDMRSLSGRQEDYLKRAVERGLGELLHDIVSMAKAKAKNAKARRRKYFHLLQDVAALQLITLPRELEERIYDDGRRQGISGCIEQITIPAALPKIEVIHVLPKKEKATEGMDCICFESFAAVVEDRGELGRRFAASLREWACIEAGHRRREHPASG